MDWLMQKWPIREDEKVQDFRKKMIVSLRRHCKGWGANWGSDIRKRKQHLMAEIQHLDRRADQVGLSDSDWEQRSRLEGDLENIYKLEELFWQKRGEEKWILEGDANTSFFQRIANGRKRKCTITFLEHESSRVIQDQKELESHITQYFKELFGRESRGGISLHRDIWLNSGGLSEEDKQELIEPFTMKELEDAVADMKSNTAPGPDGFPVEFYKKCWVQLREPLKEMKKREFILVMVLRNGILKWPLTSRQSVKVLILQISLERLVFYQKLVI